MGRVKTAKTRRPAKASIKERVRALGGDGKDWEMVKGVEDAGAEDGGEADPGLEEDVAKFMKGLDFGKVGGAAADDDDDDEGSEKAASPPPAPAPKPAPKERPKPDMRVAEAAGKVAQITRTGTTKFLVPPASQWYATAPPLAPAAHPAPSPAFLASQSARAAALLEADAAAYAASSAHTSSAADARFLARVLTAGTLSDRLSALTLLAQGSPVHNARALESLRAMAGKKGREESLKALRAVVDWWVGGGAPDRKLRYFRDQPLTHPGVTELHLVLWHFEDWLKKYFFAILQLLETLSVDPLPYVRTQALNLLFQLLRDKPEQEQNLLRLLVHKLGDAEKAVASKASHALLQLLQTHPQMKGIIVQEVSTLILKPAAPPPSKGTAPTSSKSAAPAPAPEGNTHARYYAVITFNQIVLLPGDKAVAARLVDVYFALFRAILGEDAPEAAAAAADEPRDFTPKKRRGFQGKKGKGKGKAVGDLGFQEVPDGNAKLVSQILTGINRALPFAKTENSAAFDAHVDTLFRITHTATFNVSLQALTLLQHVAAQRPGVADRFYRALYTSLVDARLASSAKQAMYLNLLFRAVKADRMPARVAAFVRRIVQVLGGHQPAFICGGLFLLGELFGVAEEVRDMTTVGRVEAEGAEGYDARKRDPQFAHATASCLWELLPLQQHYHPSVALHARQLLAHTRVTATADLGLNTLGHFLDRFVYRNARKPRARGESAMQPGAGGAGSGVVKGGRAGETEDALNGQGFRQRAEGDVPVDQVFFHKFFARKHEKEVARRGKSDRRKGKGADGESGSDHGVEEAADDGDEDEDGSDAEEAEVWKAMKASVPDLAGSDVDDSSVGDIADNDEDDADQDDADDSDGSEVDFLEDEDDLLSDAADPPGLLEYASDSASAAGEDEWEGFEARPQKRARPEAEAEGGRRKKRRGLPTFASYEDYAGMIEQGAEDNV